MHSLSLVKAFQKLVFKVHVAFLFVRDSEAELYGFDSIRQGQFVEF